jgi:SAM-dependent MidA family methyltransferase
MATPRRRSSPTPIKRFEIEKVEETLEVSEKPEEETVEELLEVVTNEIFEAIELTEEKVQPEVFVEESIVPTEDSSLRFASEPEPVKAVTLPVEVPKAPPKRHPRNTPKFSRTSK